MTMTTITRVEIVSIQPTFDWSTNADRLHCCTVTYPAQTMTVCYAAQPANPALTGYRLIHRLERFTRRETA